jgi:hypothetical protein
VTVRDAEDRGRDLNDGGQDIAHRALVRRFTRSRQAALELAANPKRKLPATRKGRSFKLPKRVAIWRAIFATRPAGWKPGDHAPFGTIAEAHRLAAAECTELGVTPPRYRTVYVLWHRGVPGSDVSRALEAGE